MLEVGWSEILVIALVLIIVVGPKDLPPMLRTFGKMAARLRGMANEFKGQFDEALREAELDDVRKGLSEVNKLNPTNSLRDAINPIRQLGQDIKADLQKTADSAKISTASSEPSEGAAAAEEVTGKAEEADLVNLAADAKPSDPLVSPVVPIADGPRDAIASVGPAAAMPVAATPSTVSTTPAVAEPAPVKPKTSRAKKSVASGEGADVAAPAEPKTRKSPVRTKDAAVAAVAAESAAKKTSSRKKSVTADAVSEEAAKPKKTSARKKTENTGDA